MVDEARGVALARGVDEDKAVDGNNVVLPGEKCKKTERDGVKPGSILQCE